MEADERLRIASVDLSHESAAIVQRLGEFISQAKHKAITG